MTEAIVDGVEDEHGAAWWFLDLLAVERRGPSTMDTVVLEAVLPVGSSPPMHVHADLDDSWYMVEGEMVLRCGDEVRRAGPGDWVSLPRGVPHSFRVVGECPARLLMVHDNGTFRDLVRSVGTPTTEHVVPPVPVRPPMDELVRAAGAQGITFVGPPMAPDDPALLALLGGDPATDTA
ncbi:MAG TPA: cupin domain-containing protein [Iamia sp.]